jgi:hypothetical protein
MELQCDQVLPGLGCDYTATGKTVDDIQAAMTAHLAEQHADLTARLSPAEKQQRNKEISDRIVALFPGLIRPPTG